MFESEHVPPGDCARYMQMGSMYVPSLVRCKTAIGSCMSSAIPHMNMMNLGPVAFQYPSERKGLNSISACPGSVGSIK